MRGRSIEILVRIDRGCGHTKTVNQEAGPWLNVTGSPWSTAAPSLWFMLETIAIILVLLWLLGLVSSYTMGGFIHILLVIAVIVVVVRLISGRKV